MEHPNKEKLEKYAARQISADEMTAIILHLENCAECSDAVERIVFSVENEGVTMFSESQEEVFHLDYDEHLQPFVDNQADAATREIVESHTQACANCAFQLRELREFADSLRLREIEKNYQPEVSIFQRAAHFLGNLSHHLAFTIAAVCLVFLLTVSIWLLGGANQTDNKPEVSKVTDNASSNLSPTVISPTPEALPPDNSTIEETKNPTRIPLKQDKEKEAAISKSGTSDGDKIEQVNNLPEEFREEINSATTTGRIAVPAALEEIVTLIKPRGEEIEEIVEITPDREILKENKPKFSWTANRLKNESYFVEIYDENNNPVAVSPPLTKNYWVSEKFLESGKSYQWVLRVSESKTATVRTDAIGKFSILDQAAQTRLKNLKTVSALHRGIIFASLGLIKDARREFRKAAAISSKSLARNFLRQIAKYP